MKEKTRAATLTTTVKIIIKTKTTIITRTREKMNKICESAFIIINVKVKIESIKARTSIKKTQVL